MSVKNYRFVSPGVFVNEIDNSQLPASPAGIGPVIIGRAASGPALRPTTVNSFEEFVNIFGTPTAGGNGDDVWRQGNNTTAPTYGIYAAQAYLRNSSPLTYIRLLGADKEGVSGGSASGEAGWLANNAYGLVLFETGSGIRNTAQLTGALAAVFYGTGTNVTFELSGALAAITSGSAGNMYASSASVTGAGPVVASLAGNREFKLLVKNSGTTIDEATFNFSQNDAKYIRKVFNTNPQRTNTAISTDTKKYFLGETFDRHVVATLETGQAQGFAAIVQLRGTGSTTQGRDFNGGLTNAQSPQIISCRLNPTDVPQNLFKIVALGESGDWTNKNLKVSIQDIKVSTTDAGYGSFSVVVRHLSDSDNVVRVIEQFNNCDLNPDSLNYVARIVGDKRLVWGDTERRYRVEGNYDNRSNHIRLEMNDDVEGGVTDARLLPFGFDGFVKYNDEDGNNQITGGLVNPVAATRATNKHGLWLSGSDTGVYASQFGVPKEVNSGSLFVVSGNYPHTLAGVGIGAMSFDPVGVFAGLSASVFYPTLELRVNASDGNLNNPTDAYFGLQTSETVGSTVFDKSTIDLLRPRGGLMGSMFAAGTSNNTERSMVFTLDDVSSSSGTWTSGSFDPTLTGSAAARNESGSLTYNNGPVTGVLDAGFDRFTVPLYGGFDGNDILEMDPFANRNIGSSESTSYEFYAIRRAMDAISDPEVVQMNLASKPALTNTVLTTHLIRTCEARGDALAVVDLSDNYIPREESTTITRNNTDSNIRQAILNLRDRQLNSSYGCTFYPWVRARDTINGSMVWLPPSIAAIGTFSSSQRKTQVWFAPAGFNRGGLSEGAAGIPVVDVAHRLTRKNRDDLYDANINPIAKFPAEGIVIFGQKTLQTTPSALDRINVRRLMIFVKKRISQMAATILFDPNTKTTWSRFLSRVEPFLAEVKTNFGLSEYKVILDETTTTPELIDRNILYAQIFLKPTRAIEFIAIDFNISRTGASFDD